MLGGFGRKLSIAGKHDRSTRNPRARTSGKRKEVTPNPAGSRVLLFSGMWELALYRAEVLRVHGFHVLIPRTKEEAVHAIKSGDLDVAVLTYTLPNETVHELADLFREHCPGCRLVAISESNRVDRKIAPDAIVLAEEGPAGLIQTLRRLTARH